MFTRAPQLLFDRILKDSPRLQESTGATRAKRAREAPVQLDPATLAALGVCPVSGRGMCALPLNDFAEKVKC